MLKITGLALAAALVAGAAQAQSIKPGDQADLQCLAVMSTYAGMSEADSAPQKAAIAGIWYFYGRLEGRSPDVNWLEKLFELMGATTMDQLDAWTSRCETQLMERGQAMTDWSDGHEG